MVGDPITHKRQHRGGNGLVDLSILADRTGLGGLEEVVEAWHLPNGGVVVVCQRLLYLGQVRAGLDLNVALAVERQYRDCHLREKRPRIEPYGASAYGWAINFDDGFTGYNSGSATGKNGGPEWNYFTGAWVRCVR